MKMPIMVILFLFIIVSCSFGQSDSLFRTDPYKITYLTSKPYDPISKNDTLLLTDTIVINDVEKTIVKGDSIIVTSGKGIKIEDIDKITFRAGRNGWTGAGIGLVSGLTLGALIGSTFKGDFAAFGMVASVVVFGSGGAIIGGILGVFNFSYDTYKLKYKTPHEKKIEIIKLLKKYKK